MKSVETKREETPWTPEIGAEKMGGRNGQLMHVSFRNMARCGGSWCRWPPGPGIGVLCLGGGSTAGRLVGKTKCQCLPLGGSVLFKLREKHLHSGRSISSAVTYLIYPELHSLNWVTLPRIETQLSGWGGECVRGGH